MTLNRGDMKLLVECGYSAVLRNIDLDVGPIFDALEIWMPEHGAATIGHALGNIVAGDVPLAIVRLKTLIESDRTGRDEARAILALCYKLQNNPVSAQAVSADIEGPETPSAQFASLVMNDGQQAPKQTPQGSNVSPAAPEAQSNSSVIT